MTIPNHDLGVDIFWGFHNLLGDALRPAAAQVYLHTVSFLTRWCPSKLLVKTLVLTALTQNK